MSEQTCETCGHLADPHVLVVTGASPVDGGIMLCPEAGCLCFSTWSTSLGPEEIDVVVPSMDEVEKLREWFQTR